MPTYDPTDHPLLSTAAAALGETVLEAQADTAEALLGSRLGSLSEATALLAVVHQVNHQIERGVEGFGVKSWSRGQRSASYADGDDGAVSPLAQAILATVSWDTIGSLR